MVLQPKSDEKLPKTAAAAIAVPSASIKKPIKKIEEQRKKTSSRGKSHRLLHKNSTNSINATLKRINCVNVLKKVAYSFNLMQLHFETKTKQIKWRENQPNRPSQNCERVKRKV